MADHLFLGILQLMTSIMASILFGVLNPVKRPKEEAIIAGASVFFIPFMV